MIINQPHIYRKRPPTGFGIQKCQRDISLPFFVWWQGHIEQFCPTLPVAIAFIGALVDGGELPE